MTKEDFDAEVYEYAKSRNGTEDSRMTDRMLAYRAGAESREKEIKSLGERCLQLQKDKGELIDKVKELEDKLANADYQLEGRDLEIKELEAQIEKMKCCGNCAKKGHICVAEEMQGKLCGKNKDKWELRR